VKLTDKEPLAGVNVLLRKVLSSGFYPNRILFQIKIHIVGRIFDEIYPD
jgi:hypothetical protein